MKIFKIIGTSVVFLFLTILTQVGGVVYLLSLFVTKKIQKKIPMKKSLVFFSLYFLSTFVLVPVIAPFFGREPIRESGNIHSVMWLSKALNRNYVRAEMNEVLEKVSKGLEASGSEIKLHCLDANFPFWDGFPLLPHLSHKDGKKLDLSLIYEDASGEITDTKPSNSGYGVFAGPSVSEFDQIGVCKKQGYFQYDYPKYFTLGTSDENLKFSEKGTRLLVHEILKQDQIGKVFIEPHLKQRLGLSDSRIRYHGCRSVRHDDHIHIQLK